MSKEDVYDEKINPLMAEIIKICEANKIGFVASFFIGENDDETLACTSFKIGEECQLNSDFVKPVLKLLRSFNVI